MALHQRFKLVLIWKEFLSLMAIKEPIEMVLGVICSFHIQLCARQFSFGAFSSSLSAFLWAWGLTFMDCIFCVLLPSAFHGVQQCTALAGTRSEKEREIGIFFPNVLFCIMMPAVDPFFMDTAPIQWLLFQDWAFRILVAVSSFCPFHPDHGWKRSRPLLLPGWFTTLCWFT